MSHNYCTFDVAECDSAFQYQPTADVAAVINEIWDARDRACTRASGGRVIMTARIFTCAGMTLGRGELAMMMVLQVSVRCFDVAERHMKSTRIGSCIGAHTTLVRDSTVTQSMDNGAHPRMFTK